MAKYFNFDLYRLNIVDLEDLFLKATGKDRIRSDEAIVGTIENACSPEFDQRQETRRSEFLWSLRQFSDYRGLAGRSLVSVVLARSVIKRDGLIVTDEGISTGTSSSTPPLAAAMVIIFDLKRHLVAVEHSGELIQTAWKDFLEKILVDSALASSLTSSVELEPVPEKHGIIGLFRSYERITRLKVTLRIPNPELSRYTRALYEDLTDSGVREYTQDMKNPNGLSKSEEARPFASASLAEQGYKKGDVEFHGLRDGEYEIMRSGSDAARGKVPVLRDFVRGLQANATTQEGQRALDAIIQEIDKLHPIRHEDK